MVILTNGEGGGALVEEVKCTWVGWATGRTVPACVDVADDALIATGVWLALALAVVLGCVWPARGYRLDKKSCRWL
jgi:hypothetical protein